MCSSVSPDRLTPEQVFTGSLHNRIDRGSRQWNYVGKARELAAWLGLVPRQYSTGGKPKLLGISKRGNPYARMLFIHVLDHVSSNLNRDNHELGLWMTKLDQRAHKNVVAVALANKMARIAGAVLARYEVYRSSSAVAQ